MNKTLTMVVSFLCAAGCSSPPAATEVAWPEPAAVASITPAVAPSFRGAFTEQAALSLLFKDAAAGVLQFPLPQQGSERLLFVFETNEADNECHACRRTIGAAIFAHEGETWRVVISQLDVAQGPPYGASADGSVSVIKIGPERYALKVASGDMHFGVIQSGVSLTEVKPGFPDVFTLMLGGNNEGNCTEEGDAEPPELVSAEPCYDFSGDLVVMPGANAEYHDLVVTFRGTHVLESDKKLVPFNETQRYVYRDGKYVPGTR